MSIQYICLRDSLIDLAEALDHRHFVLRELWELSQATNWHLSMLEETQVIILFIRYYLLRDKEVNDHLWLD